MSLRNAETSVNLSQPLLHPQYINIFEYGLPNDIPKFSSSCPPSTSLPSSTPVISVMLSVNCQEKKSNGATHLVIWETTLKTLGVRAVKHHFPPHGTLPHCRVYIPPCSLLKPISPQHGPLCLARPPGPYTHHLSPAASLLDYWDSTFPPPHHIHDTAFPQLTKKEKEDHKIVLRVQM